VGLKIKELERLYGITNGGKGSNQHVQLSNKYKAVKTQEDIANDIGISIPTLQNYKLLAEMIPKLDDLVTTGIVTKTTALAMMRIQNYVRSYQITLVVVKNDPEKDRKALATYVPLRGYKHGEIGGGHQRCHNGISGLTLDEIAKELNTSKRNLQRALSIERNLTESMKELLDTGVINYLLIRLNQNICLVLYLRF